MSNSENNNINSVNTRTGERKKKVFLNNEKLEILKRMVKRGASANDISNSLDISSSSARSYKRKIEEGNELLILQPNYNKNLETQAISTSVVGIISENNSLTLNGIKNILSENGINRSRSTICRILKSNNFTRKRITKGHIERNSEQNINLRQNFCRILSEIDDNHLIFIDETGINLHSNQSYGYAPQSSTPVIIQNSSRGINISVLVAINVNGVISYIIKDGDINSQMFCQIFNQISSNLDRNTIIIVDNEKINKSQEIIDYFQNLNIRVEYLPPYSQRLNPIDQYFARFKNKIRISNNIISTREQLKNLAIEILEEDFTFSMSGYYRHMRRYQDAGLQRTPF